MPIPEFSRLGDSPTTQDITDYVHKLQKELNYLLSSLDTLNVSRLDAKVIKTGTLDANLVTIRSDLSGSAYLQMDGDGIRGNNGTINTFEIDTTGNAYFGGNITADATITGATIRTGEVGSDRIELSGGKFRGITASGYNTGLFFDIGSVAGTGIADIVLAHNGTRLLEFYDGITMFTIRPASGATGMSIGRSGYGTSCEGTWDFSSATVEGLSLSTSSNGTHNHGMPEGTVLMLEGGATRTFVASGSHSHSVS